MYAQYYVFKERLMIELVPPPLSRLEPPENIDPSTNLARDNPAKTFTFDNVFDKKAVQVDVYNRVARCGMIAHQY